ncbi:MAG: nuclear transport factor 2 family protein [Flaviramulus sp.]|nr:nuclear transport factor 2 family protein [Flaviramulus sp.]NNC50198.1 nuclear transport factor 2 family protein [Flaviramulus sp.]
MKAISVFISVFLFLGINAFSQNTTNLKAINIDIWSNFTKAFEELDYELFSSLHCDDLVRVSGDSKSIKSKAVYIDGYKSRWTNQSIKRTISFRFLERICNDKTASERGIYKLTIYPDSPNEKSYYGKFHVLLKKENGSWKILVDYDSSESNTIDESTFNEAFALDDFDKY